MLCCLLLITICPGYMIIIKALYLQPPPSPDREWDSEEEEEDGIADQDPLDISWYNLTYTFN